MRRPCAGRVPSRYELYLKARDFVVGKEAVNRAIESTRDFVDSTYAPAARVAARGGTLKEAWDAVHHQPVSTLMEDVVVEDTLPLTSSGSTTTKENITKDGTLADLSPQKSKTMAAHPENVGPGGGNNNGGNNGSVRGGARGGASGGATASFSCTSLKTFDQSLPLTLKDFHKCVQTQAQMIRDQLQRGWLSCLSAAMVR